MASLFKIFTSGIYSYLFPKRFYAKANARPFVFYRLERTTNSTRFVRSYYWVVFMTSISPARHPYWKVTAYSSDLITDPSEMLD